MLFVVLPETGKRRSSVVRRRRRTFSSPDLKDLYDGREIYEVLAEAPDPEAVKVSVAQLVIQLFVSLVLEAFMWSKCPVPFLN